MNLVPLKVPHGWEVKQNHFYDVTLEENLKDDLLEYPFYEDILHIINRNELLLVDLGWYPDSDPNGKYRVVLLKGVKVNVFNPPIKKKIERKIGEQKAVYILEESIEFDWDHPIEVFYSKKITEIQNKINEYLSYNN